MFLDEKRAVAPISHGQHWTPPAAQSLAPVFSVLGLLAALIAAPLVYIITMAVLNGRRLQKFQREFVPAIVEAARGSEPAGISQAG